MSPSRSPHGRASLRFPRVSGDEPNLVAIRAEAE